MILFAASARQEIGLLILAFGSILFVVLTALFLKKRAGKFLFSGEDQDRQFRVLWAIAFELFVVIILLAPVSFMACELLFLQAQIGRAFKEIDKENKEKPPSHSSPYLP